MKKALAAILTVLMMSNVGFAEKNKALWENLKTLKTGQKIQIVQTNAMPLEGKFSTLSDDEITITVNKKPVVVQRSEVRRVVKVGSRTTHALIGLMIGTAVGFSIASSSSGDAVYGALAALPAISGGGAAVGAALPVKSVIYERP